ncbi:MAG: nitrile hydratase subunit beta [Dongiaceae bacterium]
MDGIHDMGGMHGFGPIEREMNEPPFHADWERRMLGISLTLPSVVSISDDHLRREVERIAPELYLRMSYYERWLEAMTQLLTEHGALDGSATFGPAVRADAVPAAIAGGYPLRLPDNKGRAARFKPGERVRGRNMHPDGHTRLPRYARGRIGTIETDLGVFGLPDANAAGRGSEPQHCYTVAFTLRELWGDSASATDTLRLDLWDDYLEPA